MNFIAAVLLLFMDEGDAFWLMGVLIEEIIPQDYYSKAMLGVKSDERLWLEILQSRLPKVYNHLQKMDINLTGTIIGWFMSMYINILPLEVRKICFYFHNFNITVILIYNIFLYKRLHYVF